MQTYLTCRHTKTCVSFKHIVCESLVNTTHTYMCVSFRHIMCEDMNCYQLYVCGTWLATKSHKSLKPLLGHNSREMLNNLSHLTYQHAKICLLLDQSLR